MEIKTSVKYIMPVLEKDIFETHKLIEIRDFLLPYKDKILTIRVGANDLMSELRIRRECGNTIYDISPISIIISNIINFFKPYGFNISGVVYECFGKNHLHTLKREVELDLQNGIFSKTIIHPSQIDIIQECYRVNKNDLDSANKILNKNAKAVFQTDNRMNEISVHTNWAKEIIERSKIYGIKKF